MSLTDVFRIKDLIESEDIFNQLEDIFFQTFSESLNEKTLELIEQNKSRLFFEINENLDQSWSELMIDGLQEEAEDWIEAEVYLLIKDSHKKLALILLNLDMDDEKECHIQWFNAA